MNLRQGSTLLQKHVTPILFFLLAGFGIFLHRDYGISSDETISLMNGLVTLNNMAEVFGVPRLIGPYKPMVPSISEWTDRDYGVVFEATSAAVGIALKMRDFRDLFFFRHLLTFFVFLCGAYAVYRIALLRSRKEWLAYLILAFYILSPRQFAEGFYNSKDIVFMSFFACGIYANLLFLNDTAPWRGLAASLLSALVIDVRITGIILPASLIVILLVRALKGEISKKDTPGLLVFFATLPVLIVMFWPYLWSDPFGHFVESFVNMSKFHRWTGDVLLNGERFLGTDLPWYYAPLWMLVTIPPYYTVLILIGGVIIITRIGRSVYRLWNTEEDMQDLIFLGLSVGPIVIVVLLNSVLYNGWRHLYFVYPALLLMAVPAIEALGGLLSALSQRLLWVFYLPLLHPLFWMIQAHPYQNVYFNAFAGQNRFQRWEMDYWGLSNREALEYILETDERDTIKVQRVIASTPLGPALLILKPQERRRFVLDFKDGEPDYWITNFRGVKQDWLTPPVGFHEVYRIIVDGEPILVVFKREHESNGH